MDKATDNINTVFDCILEMGEIKNAKAYEAIAHNDQVKRAIECAKRGEEWDFYEFTVGPFEHALDGLLAQVTASEEAKFVFKHGRFVQGHFENMFEKYEGPIFCADKSNTIMRSLIPYFLHGKEINFDYGQKYTFLLPKHIFKKQTEILEFFRGLHDLHYGSPEKYLSFLGRYFVNRATFDGRVSP